MSTIRFLRTFVAVARHGSFAIAAEQMALTQSAVSMQMRALETEFKHELFDRSGRKVLLNAMGKNLLPHAQQLLAVYEAMRMTAGGLEKDVGPVTIGAVESVVGALAEAAAHLKMTRPNLDVRITAAKSVDLAARVDSGEIDAAVIIDTPGRRPASVQWTPVYSEPVVLLVNTNVADAPPAELLKSQRFLRFDRTQRTGALIDRALRKQRFKVNEFLELNSLEGIAELVRQGIGIAVVPLLRRSSWTRDDALRVVPLPEAGVKRHVGMLERAQHGKMGVTGALVRELKEVI
ncbi:LysR family transcriptional regulator [Burkholderia sp. SRS-W-2-2016]|uniref:LysR family transcriptional regulator n=1 Tax=Burkholderia sp. SRS-W-2-2016 TaxID=1926878 RepID=UPI00094AC0F3|nr:LysR family transcriptional regulator [Burkholderia sp. SRS-W-2-2016]OLL31746.1 LysR family transcriptional regulator [Burkholderia sp. SRS-W-2-2016]